MILIVDDDPSVTASLALLLKQAGYASHSVAGPEAALAWLARERCDLVIQDMNFSRRTTGEEGLDLLARVKSAAPSLPVILITAWGSIGLAVEGMKRGAGTSSPSRGRINRSSRPCRRRSVWLPAALPCR